MNYELRIENYFLSLQLKLLNLNDMKKLIIPILSLLILSIWSCDQGQTPGGNENDTIDSVEVVETDPSLWIVKTITEETMEYVVDEVTDTNLVEITQFDIDGKKISLYSKTKGGEEYTTTYFYEDNLLIREESAFMDGTLFAQIYNNDTVSHITEIFWQDDENPNERLAYNDKGQVIERNELEESSGWIVARTTYTYNEKGQLVTEETSNIIDEEVYKRVTYEYDENGNETKQTCWSDEDPSDNYVVTKEYLEFDETGRWTSCVRIENNETTDYSYKSLIKRKIEYYK